MSEKTGLKFIRFGELISQGTNSSFLLWFQCSASVRRSLAWNFMFKDSILKWLCQFKSACWELSASAKIMVLYYFSPLDRFPFSCNVQPNVLIWPNFKNVRPARTVSVGQSRLLMNFAVGVPHRTCSKTNNRTGPFRTSPLVGHKNSHYSYSFCCVIRS